MRVPEQLPSHTVEGHPHTGTVMPPTMPSVPPLASGSELSVCPTAARGTSSATALQRHTSTQRIDRRFDIRVLPKRTGEGQFAGHASPIRGRGSRFPLQKRLELARVALHGKRAAWLLGTRRKLLHVVELEGKFPAQDDHE